MPAGFGSHCMWVGTEGTGIGFGAVGLGGGTRGLGRGDLLRLRLELALETEKALENMLCWLWAGLGGDLGGR